MKQKIRFTAETRKISEMSNSVISKLDKVESEEQLSLEDIQSFKTSVQELLNILDEEIDSWM